MKVDICDVCWVKSEEDLTECNLATHSYLGISLCKYHFNDLKDFIEYPEHWEYNVQPGDDNYNEVIGMFFQPIKVIVHKEE